MERTELSTEVKLVSPARIDLSGVSKSYDDIVKLSKHMETVEVTEENIKESKKLLATVRKEWNKLDTQRKDIKKQVLEPYDELDEKLKEMKAILEAGESNIATQLNDIREAERQEALKDLEYQFDLKHKAYNAPKWLSFDKFMEPNMTLVNNKNTSHIKKVTALRDFFERYAEDYAKVKERYPLEDERTAILLSYSTNGLNMDKAVEAYEAMIAEKERLHEAQEALKRKAKPTISINVKPEKPKATPMTKTFEFADVSDYDKAVKLLHENKVNFVVK